MKEDLETDNATSSAPVELSRMSHSRFGSRARDPVSDTQPDDVEMGHEDARDYEPDATYGISDGSTNCRAQNLKLLGIRAHFINNHIS